MNVKTVGLLVFALFCFSAKPAKAMTAAELKTACSAVTVSDDVATADQSVANIICLSYLRGFAETIGTYLITLKDSDYDYTFAEGTSPLQIAKSFLTYITQHPDQEGQPATTVLRDATFTAGLLHETKVIDNNEKPCAQPTKNGAKL